MKNEMSILSTAHFQSTTNLEKSFNGTTLKENQSLLSLCIYESVGVCV